MKKIRLDLTAEQIARGIAFSSTLSKAKTEQPGDLTHEVYKNDPEIASKIDRLLDDKFFDPSPWSYNIIRC